MKKVAAIATALLGVIVIGAYVLLANRPAGGPADPEGANEDAPALTGKMSPAASPDATGGAADVSPEWLDLSKPRWHSSTSGAVTEFDLFEGEIGYVDVNSVVQDRNPYSVVALLKKHRALTGAGESLELEIESTGKTPKGYSADFAQVIGGTRTEGRGVVAFDTSGAVYVAYGDLLDTNVADAGAIKILQAEAEAIALEAARRYSETRRSTSVARGESLRTVIYAAELRYALDPDAGNALRAEWRLAIGTFSPYDSLEVLVSAETGEVVSVESVVMEYTVTQARCEGVKFRVCDAGLVATQVSCSSGSANPVDPILTARIAWRSRRASAKSASTRHPKIMHTKQ